MATTTACLLGGSSHPNHGGIIPSHQLLLSENDRPAWVLSRLDGSRDDVVVWIPTVEDMLEDGLLMAGLLAARDASLTQLASTAFRKPYDQRVEMYEDIGEAQRRELYGACRRIGSQTKAVLCVLHGSSVAGQIGILADYAFDVEVCCPVFEREKSAWSGGTSAAGVLQMPLLQASDRK